MVSAFFALVLLPFTEYFWVWSLLLMGAYIGVGFQIWLDEKNEDPALQTENRVVE